MVAASSPFIVGSVLFGADEMVANMVAARIPNFYIDPEYRALGVVRHGRLIGGAVYHRFIGHDIQVSVAFDDPHWVRRDTLRTLFGYPFNQLGCKRMTALVGRKNKKSRKLTEGMGFKLEGVHLKGFDGYQDLISYGMTRETCRWIKERPNGQKYASSSRAA